MPAQQVKCECVAEHGHENACTAQGSVCTLSETNKDCREKGPIKVRIMTNFIGYAFNRPDLIGKEAVRASALHPPSLPQQRHGCLPCPPPRSANSGSLLDARMILMS